MPARGKTNTERTCVLTGKIKHSGHMVRFVDGPEGEIVPDVAQKLPGRGVWMLMLAMKQARKILRKLLIMLVN